MLFTLILLFHQVCLKNSTWNWSPVGCDTVTEWVVPNIQTERDGTWYLYLQVKQFKNAGNILPSTPHHIPVKLNHQQHCCDILRSHKMYTIYGTRIYCHVTACVWTFTLSYMSPFCTFTKCFIPIQDEPLWVRSVYEGISKVLIELLSTLLKVFPHMCYDTLILSSIISFFVRNVRMMNLLM